MTFNYCGVELYHATVFFFFWAGEGGGANFNFVFQTRNGLNTSDSVPYSLLHSRFRLVTRRSSSRGGEEDERCVTRQKRLRGDDNEIQYNIDLKVY